MFSCFIDLGLPTLFSGYDLLDYSPTRGLSPALNRDDSGCLGDRKAVVDSPAEPRASQSNGFLKFIKSFFAFCFSCWQTSAEPRAAVADETENAGGQGGPGNCASQGNEDDSVKASDGVESHGRRPNIIHLPFDSDDEEHLIESAKEERTNDLIAAESESSLFDDDGCPVNILPKKSDKYSHENDRDSCKRGNNSEPTDSDDSDTSYSDAEDENSLAY
ncbi:MAG TPA: hypothetical protein VF797_19995 [Noviherbaspirillum sp.]|jgi:hypothetical protein